MRKKKKYIYIYIYHIQSLGMMKFQKDGKKSNECSKMFQTTIFPHLSIPNHHLRVWRPFWAGEISTAKSTDHRTVVISTKPPHPSPATHPRPAQSSGHPVPSPPGQIGSSSRWPEAFFLGRYKGRAAEGHHMKSSINKNDTRTHTHTQ